MKKLVSLLLGFGLLISFTQPSIADTPTKPTLTSFTMTPDVIDIATGQTSVNFRLTVNNQTGIYSTQTQLTLSDGGNYSLTATLVRSDAQLDKSLSTVTFLGTITIPSNFPSGAYFASAKPIVALNSDGSPGYSTDTLYATSGSKVVGAEDALLIRKNGDLNYNFSTFKGPAYDKTLGLSYVNPSYTTVASPIWKVGESVDLSKYYELSVPSLSLKVKSNTPTICSADGTILKLMVAGSCSFTVYTDKTIDYQYQKSDQVIAITVARPKPTYAVGSIATQSSSTLPLSIPGPIIYGPLGLVTPTTSTPTVCYASGTYITVISGGTCTVIYSSPATADYAASDAFPLTFEITRTAQTITFSLPASVELSSKLFALSATASSGGAVSFQSKTPATCSVTGNSLNLLAAGSCTVQASQAGSTTVAPASADQVVSITGATSSPATKVVGKKIVCFKQAKSKTFAGTKCPAGYKAKK